MISLLNHWSQKGPARKALAELEGWQLERAARDRNFARVIEGNLPFVSDPEDAGHPESFVFPDVARDLRAAQESNSHLRQREVLTRAEARLLKAQESLARLSRTTYRLQHRQKALRTWLEATRDELAALERRERERPQVPTPFVVGPALKRESPRETTLFKGRRDMAHTLDQDLVGDRSEPLLLYGQRRMGKSSLLHMLPELLGAGTVLAPLNFQSLSGRPWRAHPHLEVARRVAAAWPEGGYAVDEEDAATWGPVLDDLARLEEPLRRADRRILVAIDEVEALQTGIDEGWTDGAFLDFVRAAGDRLRRTRFLLLSARPMDRLGPHWESRLISALPRHLTYLDEDAARSLLTEPIPDFPDIYPPGAVERILHATHRHPYLLQAVGKHLTERLVEVHRMTAEPADVERALDEALHTASATFGDLWHERTGDERRLLAHLASHDDGAALPEDAPPGMVRVLERQGYITAVGEGGVAYRVAVPLFAWWIQSR